LNIGVFIWYSWCRELGKPMEFVRLVSVAAAEEDAWKGSLALQGMDKETFATKRGLVHEWVEKGGCRQRAGGILTAPPAGWAMQCGVALRSQVLCSGARWSALSIAAAQATSPGGAGYKDVLRKALSLAPLCIQAPKE